MSNIRHADQLISPLFSILATYFNLIIFGVSVFEV